MFRGLKLSMLTGRLLQLAADTLLLCAMLLLSLHLRGAVLPNLFPSLPPLSPSMNFLSLWWMLIPLVFLLYYEGLYTQSVPLRDEVLNIIKSVFFATVGVFTFVSLVKMGQEVSRLVVIELGVLSLIALPVERLLLGKVLRKAGLLTHRVLILGAGTTGALMLRALSKEPNLGYRVIAFVDDDPQKAGTSIGGVAVHEGLGSAERLIDELDIDVLIIAMPGAEARRASAIINHYQHRVRSILLVPEVFGTAVLGTRLYHFFEEQAFALEVKNNLARPANYALKRTFDYIVGFSLCLLLLLPLLLIALIIRSTSRGPAFFIQPRIGRGGRTFDCIKFRTMYDDAEERLCEILDTDSEAKQEYETYWKLKCDPRITPVGRFLRNTSLDELPQIINVLKGDMSFVGPRPYILRERPYLQDAGDTILSVLPGITGLWQVSGRSSTNYDYRLTLDAWYVRNWNLWLDMVILFRTVSVVLRKQGAY